MVRHQQHLAAQRRPEPRHQGRFLRRFDVAGEQQAASAGALHAQHAAQRIGAGRRQVVAGHGVQQLETHAVPVPGLSGGAAPVRHAARQQRVALGQRAGHRGHRQPRQQRGGATDMVDVAVAQHQQVDAGVTARAQQWQQHALRGVGLQRVARPAVVQQQVGAGAHQHRGTLADVGRDHLELAHCRPLQRRRQQRQQQRQAERPQSPGQWHDQQCAAQQAHGHAPAWCRCGRPQAERAAGQQLQHGHQGLHQGAGHGPQRRDQDAEQCQRHDGQRHQRNGQQVGDEARQRHLLEEHQAQWRQADAGHRLGAQAAAQGLQQRAGAPATGRQRRARDRLRHHQQPHGHEGQPEARLQQRPGVEQRDHAGGPPAAPAATATAARRCAARPARPASTACAAPARPSRPAAHNLRRPARRPTARPSVPAAPALRVGSGATTGQSARQRARRTTSRAAR